MKKYRKTIVGFRPRTLNLLDVILKEYGMRPYKDLRLNSRADLIRHIVDEWLSRYQRKNRFII